MLWGARRISTSEKKMLFASQGCIFSKHHFSRASREGKQGCGEPHALAHSDKALRSQRHAFMHDPLCCKHCFSIAITDLARRRRQGRAPPRRIVLSYALSAAAVWQCDRVRAMCESNSVRHKVLFKALGLAPLGDLWQRHHNIIVSASWGEAHEYILYICCGNDRLF